MGRNSIIELLTPKFMFCILRINNLEGKFGVLERRENGLDGV